MVTTVPQDDLLRQFLLSNLTKVNKDHYRWKVNLPVIEDSLDKDFPDTDKQYNGRTLFVGGELSHYIRLEVQILVIILVLLLYSKIHLSKISQLFPSSSLKYVRGAGHWVHFEKPQQFLHLVINFLAACK